jgi:hypothetical protein
MGACCVRDFLLSLSPLTDRTAFRGEFDGRGRGLEAVVVVLVRPVLTSACHAPAPLGLVTMVARVGGRGGGSSAAHGVRVSCPASSGRKRQKNWRPVGCQISVGWTLPCSAQSNKKHTVLHARVANQTCSETS